MMKIMKSCKVIGTFFSDERIDRSYQRHGFEDVFWSTHIQFGVGPDGVLKMLEDICSLEKDVDAGAEIDTIIVNSDNGFVEGNAFLKSMNNVKTKSGKIITIEKENIGGQFGGYEYVYQKFKNDYDFWMFTEDDIIITGYKYYSKLIKRLGNRKYNTAYALVGIVEHPHFPLHACSACMLIHKTILEKIKHLPIPSENDITSRINEGEVAFSTKIYDVDCILVYEGPAVYMKTKKWPFEKDYCLPYRQLIEENKTVNDFKTIPFYTGDKNVGYIDHK